MGKVVFQNLFKSFPQRGAGSNKPPINVLEDIDFEIKDQELMVLVGPSGCGKSTLLRLIAGLETVTSGQIWVGNREVTHLPPKERDIAMVFQNYALYPHLTVYDNLAFGLRRVNQLSAKQSPSSLPSWVEKPLVTLTKPLPKNLQYLSIEEQNIQKKVQEVAQKLQIETLLPRLPKQLSGGQKQRVALGRAITRNPQVFLMDEPMSNLDAKLRAETRSQIVQLQKDLKITTIYVTHDQVEAMTMGTRITVMNQGKIQQIAPPLELYNRPANCFVAEFIGSPTINFLTVKVRTPLQLIHPKFSLVLPEKWEPYLKDYDQQYVQLGIRPEHLMVSTQSSEAIQIKVNFVENLGNESYIFGQLSNDEQSHLTVRLSSDEWLRIDQNNFWLSFNKEKIHLFDPKTEQSIWPVPKIIEN
ncbi:ABC transporter related [Rippkaea orientalis PCC 8801]|uniref:ABC transporter related n=1 Tax=Rippkaea orientalis (strain PCC 8801 / RF-1) TaxID=41431 RepID=B7K1A4_RIPO1|nr:ABC transporter ATP-binding protein [Rippkaea orientalis]ACK66299.1 ABC transporter related [Rippkaea orientalis PCC 8801]